MRANPMTEAEWQSCEDPQTMLEFLRESDRASERKLRLFAAACCREVEVWSRLLSKRSRRAVETAEQYADGLASRELLVAAGKGAFRAATGIPLVDPLRFRHYAAWAAREVALVNAWQAAVGSSRYTWPGPELYSEIFGNPFRPSPRIDPTRLAWNDGTVKHLAEAAYEHRSLPDGTLYGNRLAVLGDALEEAGCTDAQLLTHLRSPGPHFRGCFALDAVLGKC
jgi:hypothetical protein